VRAEDYFAAEGSEHQDGDQNQRRPELALNPKMAITSEQVRNCQKNVSKNVRELADCVLFS
jgi:hypothetical protein